MRTRARCSGSKRSSRRGPACRRGGYAAPGETDSIEIGAEETELGERGLIL